MGQALRQTKLDFERPILPRNCDRLDAALPLRLTSLVQRGGKIFVCADRRAERPEHAQDGFGRRGAYLAEAIAILGLDIVKACDGLEEIGHANRLNVF